MISETKRSLYVTLSAVFGLMLLIMLERGFFLLAYLLGTDITQATALVLDAFLVIIFAWLGLWYGVWMGLRWYEVVYGQRVLDESKVPVRPSRHIASSESFQEVRAKTNGRVKKTV